MKAYDFEYDGLRLSDFGYMLCSFDSNGDNTISNGSQITFNLVSTQYGNKYELTNTQYDECLNTAFQICRKNCPHNQTMEISTEDLRKLSRWLNRKSFHKLVILDDEYDGIYFEASFNINRIELGGILYGLELSVMTNRPFALQDEKTIEIHNTLSNGSYTIEDTSDEEGYIYPDMEIIIKQDGNLIITNDIEDRSLLINNCKLNEVINIKYPVITTSSVTHKIEDDFNWVFFRIANAYKNNENNLSISIPCDITIKYSPIAKVGF